MIQIDRLQEDHAIPLTLVATCDGAPVGTASLVREDLDSHPHLSPWLASVYVAPEHRSQGIGKLLCQAAVQHATRLEIKDLYLFTPDRADFYRGLGWTEIDRSVDKGKSVVVMRYFCS